MKKNKDSIKKTGILTLMMVLVAGLMVMMILCACGNGTSDRLSDKDRVAFTGFRTDTSTAP